MIHPDFMTLYLQNQLSPVPYTCRLTCKPRSQNLAMRDVQLLHVSTNNVVYGWESVPLRRLFHGP
jgi:hypothetical protein